MRNSEHGVVIFHEFGQQIFLKDLRPAVHIHLAAQLQQLTHLHFAEDWQHCSLLGLVALHHSQWVARSAEAAPGAARERASHFPLPRLTSFCAVLRSTLSLDAFLASSAQIVCSHLRMQQR